MSDGTVTISVATVDDAAGLIAFLREFQSEGHPGVFRPTRALPTLDEERSWIQSLLDHETSHLWVACVGEEIVGLLDFHGHRHPQMAHGGALGTSVLRAYRGQKIGLQLMQAQKTIHILKIILFVQKEFLHLLQVYIVHQNFLNFSSSNLISNWSLSNFGSCPVPNIELSVTISGGDIS